MPRDEIKPLTIQNARILFRNFAGKEGKYNREGDMNFCLLLDDDLAERMATDGWNVKSLRSREPDEPEQPYIQVSVSYKGRPPKIVLITSRGRTDIPQAMIEMLDWVDIANVDLIVNPYSWSVNGNSGVKAYLRALYITIQEDELELKYADVPEIGWENAAPLAIESGPDYIEGEVID